MDTNPERARDLGRRVRVKWDDDDTYYEGHVVRYNPNTGTAPFWRSVLTFRCVLFAVMYSSG